MPAVSIISDDLRVFVPNLDPAQVDVLIQGALARAAVVAPCILDDDFTYADAAGDIIRDIILRRLETGSGALRSKTAGPFSETYEPVHLRPGDISALQGLCSKFTGTPAVAMPQGSFPASPLTNRGYQAALGVRC